MVWWRDNGADPGYRTVLGGQRARRGWNSACLQGEKEMSSVDWNQDEEERDGDGLRRTKGKDHDNDDGVIRVQIQDQIGIMLD